ncbi:START-like domain-containing protein [Tenacibaculum maritimum]|uniref:START-like domain-containing protein n=1 Tax=Tenacibaculum maritimum NCIMB 2154 TaxID=1349785 RepID=A0A2H1E8Q7_9FLAO|nr:START-like domain-containing protein [Tenacibaculum maritimum]MCD9563627.1 SRPBCC domain-containing protein [Tenacibaculum maritimum]MCD9564520.1 SRPBCC domain-containing protein [Tenacibaculum maritimum]MCD9578129.1 SRPBCC domain-containing protein [Tenacibaculum maritimum]MCD9582701.1 SRPBCC domain-containing protein [Tenacibaculum maritimum]MCD9595524.1 SRPBCC domain-containing protein [Tenacibaculum maritimum]
MSKVKFELEFPIHASPSMLYQYFATPAGLEEWFADKVNSRGKQISFFWDGTEEEAKILVNKSDERIKFKWAESEGDESYFEFRIQVDALTKDVSLMVTDFADSEDDLEESKMLWENQIDELKHTIGA